MYHGAGFLLILLPGAILWFIVVWYTQIHNFQWRQALGWFVLGRVIGFTGAIALGNFGIHLPLRSQIWLMVFTTALTLVFFVFREFRNKSLLIRLKIMLTWVITDSIFGWLGIYLRDFPQP